VLSVDSRGAAHMTLAMEERGQFHAAVREWVTSARWGARFMPAIRRLLRSRGMKAEVESILRRLRELTGRPMQAVATALLAGRSRWHQTPCSFSRTRSRPVLKLQYGEPENCAVSRDMRPYPSTS
jgi:hypothetical protein